MPLKQGSNASVTKVPFQEQDKPALGTAWCGGGHPRRRGGGEQVPQGCLQGGGGGG